ncbi:MAG: hypothetical protein ACYCW6_23375 [Candidatus Xenobia bacterium]
MKIRHYLDPETRQPHFYKHGVEETEVEILTNPGEDRMGQDGSRAPAVTCEWSTSATHPGGDAG